MKILNVQVEDPALDGYVNSPRLIVTVDEAPTPSADPETGSTDPIFYSTEVGVFALRYFGPFIRYGFYQYSSADRTPYYADWFPNIGLGQVWSSRAGAINAAVQPDKPLVDVVLRIQNEPGMESGWAMHLDRIRREMKKYCDGWVLDVDDRLAQLGDISWVPAELIPGCLWRGKFSPRMAGDPPACGKAAYHPFMERELGLCDECKIKHDQLAALQRADRRNQLASTLY